MKLISKKPFKSSGIMDPFPGSGRGIWIFYKSTNGHGQNKGDE